MIAAAFRCRSITRGANTDDTNTSMMSAAVAAAQAADVVIAVLGDSKNTCGEMVDRSDLDLPGGEQPVGIFLSCA